MKHFILIRESKFLELFTEASFPDLAYIRSKCNQSRQKIYIVFYGFKEEGKDTAHSEIGWRVTVEVH